jgi:small subunit ribosomal protein S7
MPRRGKVIQRKAEPDPLYSSVVVAKLINQIMWDGKKSLAEEIVYGAFEIIRDRSGREPLEVFEEALNNVMPVLEVRPRRVGGATYQVPVEVSPKRRQSLAIRWLVNFSRARKAKSMQEKLAGEILDALNNTGGAVKRREEVHRMAESNRAFAHYRW